MKRLLISLFVGLFGLVSFGYCDNLSLLYRTNFSLSSASDPFEFTPGLCVLGNNYTSNLLFYNSDGTLIGYGNNTTNSLNCIDFTGYIISNSSTSHSYYYYYVWDLKTCPACSTCPTCPDCPVCDECSYSGYILESDIDTNYCVSNGLCPLQEFSGFSNLYVNDILFMPSAIYDLTIPEEFDFDYTGNENLLEIDVKGYNTDSDYIAGIISTQNNYPNDSYFNSIITDLIPKLIPGLVIILFIYFIFRFIKKIF